MGGDISMAKVVHFKEFKYLKQKPEILTSTACKNEKKKQILPHIVSKAPNYQQEKSLIRQLRMEWEFTMCAP